jgi:hypothetical protein
MSWPPTAEIMVIAGIPREEIRHTRAVQNWLSAGRQECRQDPRATAGAPRHLLAARALSSLYYPQILARLLKPPGRPRKALALKSG